MVIACSVAACLAGVPIARAEEVPSPTPFVPPDPQATSDFNNDGYSDLAVGVPVEDLLAGADAGVVHIFYGSATGFTGGVKAMYDQNTPGIPGDVTAGSRFGDALAWGDFDGNGRDDLAIGLPQMTVNGKGQGGAVIVIYSGPSGLDPTTAKLFSQDSNNVKGTTGTADFFGAALAAGNLGNGGQDDLAIQVRFDTVSGEDDAGAVAVLYGGPSGLRSTGNQLWHQDSNGIAGAALENEEFGGALAVGNFGKGKTRDLAIGTRDDFVGSVDSAGTVNVIYGTKDGLSAVGDQYWHQNSSGVPDTAETNDGFAGEVVAANFGRSGSVDLAIGITGEEVGVNPSAHGAVIVLFGSTRKGLSSKNAQLVYQGNNGLQETPEMSDGFGENFAAGNLMGSSEADLVVGVRDEDLAFVGDGAVQVIPGAPTGLDGATDQIWSQDSAGILDTNESADFFGYQVAVGNYGYTSDLDLAVAAHSEDLLGGANAGQVTVIFGSGGALSSTNNQIWNQDSAGVADTVELSDFFGTSAA